MRKFDENYSLIRVFHAVPGGDTVDIYLNDRLFYKGLNFTQFTPYIYVPNGKYTLIVYGEDTIDNPILSEEVEVNNDELITMALTGDMDDITLLQVKEDKELANGNNSKLRFVHLVPNGLPVDIIIDNITQFKGIKFRDITEYDIVSPREYTIEVVVSQNNQIVDRDKVNIKSNRIYTFYGIGYAPNFDIIQSVDGGTFLI